MLRLSNRVDNILLSRSADSKIDEFVVKTFLQQNKNILEFEFYRNDMIGSWSYKGKSDGMSGELLYVVAMKEKKAKEGEINKIFKDAAMKFKLPEYDAYLKYTKKHVNQVDIIKNLILFLTGKRVELLPKDRYVAELQKIQQSFHIPFEQGIHFQYEAVDMENRELIRIKRNVEIGKLSFMGRYFWVPSGMTVENLMKHKILEKIFGSNEVDSVYFPLRCEGKIYTAISSYIMEKGLMVTGVMADYSDELWKRSCNYAENVKISIESLESAKKRLVDDIKFVAFQYGTMFAVLPYVYALRSEVSMEEVLETINRLTIHDIEDIIGSKAGKIAMGVGA